MFAHLLGCQTCRHHNQGVATILPFHRRTTIHIGSIFHMLGTESEHPSAILSKPRKLFQHLATRSYLLLKKQMRPHHRQGLLATPSCPGSPVQSLCPKHPIRRVPPDPSMSIPSYPVLPKHDQKLDVDWLDEMKNQKNEESTQSTRAGVRRRWGWWAFAQGTYRSDLIILGAADFVVHTLFVVHMAFIYLAHIYDAFSIFVSIFTHTQCPGPCHSFICTIVLWLMIQCSKMDRAGITFMTMSYKLCILFTTLLICICFKLRWHVWIQLVLIGLVWAYGSQWLPPSLSWAVCDLN